jgi:hypothetical protein
MIKDGIAILLMDAGGGSPTRIQRFDFAGNRAHVGTEISNRRDL